MQGAPSRRPAGVARPCRSRRWRTRTPRRAWLVLGLIVGVVGGGVLTALASARRAETAYDRFLDHTNAWDIAGTLRCDPNARPDDVQTGDFIGPRGEAVSGDRRSEPPSP